MDTTSRQDEIKDYLTHKLSVEHVKTFEAEIEQNEELKAEVEFMRDAFKVLEVAVQDDLRHKIQQWSPAHKIIPTNKIQRLWRWSAAAGIILLIIAGLWYLKPADRYTLSKDLYVYVAPGNLRSNEGLTSEQAEVKLSVLFEESKKLFDQKNFQNSIDKLNEVEKLLYTYELNDKSAKEDMLDWFRLLNWYNLNPKGPEYQQLFSEIKQNSQHAYHQKLQRLR